MPSLTQSELALLLADRFVKMGPRLLGRFPIPGGTGEVSVNPLAEVLFEAALFGLDRGGHVRLARAPKSTFFGLRKTHTVIAERTGGGPPAGTLEAGLWDALGGDRVEVDEVVYRWFGADNAWPHTVVPVVVRSGLAARGLIDAAEHDEKRLLGTRTTVEFSASDTTRAALAEADVEPLRAFLAGEGDRADLHETLHAEVRQGINRRVDRTTPTAGGDYGAS